MAEETKPTLVSLLADAGQPELEDINKRIAELQRQIEQFCGQRKAEIASLKIVRRVLHRKLQPPAVRQKKPKATREGTELQRKVYDLLSKEGSMPVPAIAARLQKTPQGIAAMVGMCDWFVRENGEVHVAIKQVPIAIKQDVAVTR